MHRLLWLLGAVGLPLSHYWLIARVEPFYSLIYCFLWWSYIFVTDFFVFRLRGKSILSDRPWEFIVLWIWSIPLWLLFEVINRRLENWYYVMAPSHISVGAVYLIFAFGAVLPGVFETTELIIGLIEKISRKGKITGPPFRAHRWNVALQISIGSAMLALALVFPKSCFCLAWGFAFFLLDPICYGLSRRESNHVGRSLLGQLAAGDNTRFVALLLAGVVCGGLWEAWNLTARTKWIYSVPFFDELKLGEMPILGFLGFPPFVLECYALINLLSHFRRGRNWELTGAENRQRPGMSAFGVAACAFILPLVIGLSCLATLRNVATFAEPLDWYFESALGPSGVQALRKRHALQGNQFLKLQDRPPEIDPTLWTRMQQLARLGELKGIGLRNALLLEKLNITRLDELARQDPFDLSLKLQNVGGLVRVEETKVWIRAALRNLPG